jgi:hypothetical protein
LLTNDSFFLEAVPGLSAFPNMEMSAKTSLTGFSPVVIDANGIHITDEPLRIDFAAYNASGTYALFSVAVHFEFDMSVAPSMAANVVELAVSFANWNPTAAVLSTAVGNVSTDDIAQLAELVASQIPTLNLHLTVPADISASGPAVSFAPGYIAVTLASAQWAKPVPDIVCGDGHLCPLQNTCCNWSGHFGCCTLPSAVCCDAGCCINGCQCVDGGCQC